MDFDFSLASRIGRFIPTATGNLLRAVDIPAGAQGEVNVDAFF
jgi:hypothetical protein